jgi:hypothetical protein
MKKLIIFSIMIITAFSSFAQAVPGNDENIPYLVTFGSNSETAWGDNDFCQIIFFSIPKDITTPIYIRVFDPEIGGLNDEQKGAWNTKMFYGIYGGKGACSHEDAQKANKNGKYDSGTLLASKTFATDPNYDNKWYSFGPFNPTEGELLPDYGGNVFKILVEGTAGDDGNMYRLFLSTSPTENRPVEGALPFILSTSFVCTII